MMIEDKLELLIIPSSLIGILIGIPLFGYIITPQYGWGAGLIGGFVGMLVGLLLPFILYLSYIAIRKRLNHEQKG